MASRKKNWIIDVCLKEVVRKETIKTHWVALHLHDSTKKEALKKMYEMTDSFLRNPNSDVEAEE